MLRAGLIGFPASGKTTLFQLMTSARDAPKSGGKAEAHVGMSRVPDERLDRLTALFKPRKHVPATVEFADVAGAARSGATAAQTLLDVTSYRAADALLHVVRAFRDPSIPHPKGSVDPARDTREMEEELILADLGVVERRLERLERDLKKGPSADLRHEQQVLQRCRVQLEDGRRCARCNSRRTMRGGCGDSSCCRPSRCCSCSISTRPTRRWPTRWSARDCAVARRARPRAVPLCAKIELEIAELEELTGGVPRRPRPAESGLDRVIRASYDLLGYISFFTVGEDECRAWSIPRHTPAQLAAGEIHSDIARGFIRAEVVAVRRLLARGSLAACKEHGELRLEGKEYVVRDGDVINVRFAT
jgi:ribosome-binding ATPase